MAEEEVAWDSTVQEWLIDEGNCVAGALGDPATGTFYAAAPVEGEAGWAMVYKEPYEQMLAQEDGSEKSETIDESAIMKEVAEGKRPAKGFWVAGEKYTITRQEEDEVEGKAVKVTIAGRPKKGIVIYTTEASIVMGMFDEAKVATQNIGNCRKVVAAFTEYLVQAGY
mmetsp:Transcript_8636/g.12708  ORF Transcript_8636/g.12708 Transcript_8636/m.12708 type:complete len:168 (+) Transcript_8636:106-609(+)|eukprot:CAMPEP_0194748714 /NCGR_PEP_ID=MMETSP0323_2-20130528/2879_1 /TAXON_ID=2866 ORGANISM="Crypthecodinium cohnii, Strain Seligo" /NCGR_SAMPLE_ID=MMETSP0323_2 /ASSEMBLY_ACC=CAM_ASM_000346 /LENGTH=167 /DNA_ID=CAMNT_0039663203 /DNA_START=101 /DNA_END=604 /DNA_ORIENTATION=+